MSYGVEINGEEIDYRTLQKVAEYTTTTASGSIQLPAGFTSANCVPMALSLNAGKTACSAGIDPTGVLRYYRAFQNAATNNKIYVFRIK
jgi:hypothetical protein